GISSNLLAAGRSARYTRAGTSRAQMMSGAGTVSELLLRWEELRALGRPVSAEELCGDRPELVEEMRRQSRALEAVYRGPRGAGPDPGTLSLGPAGPAGAPAHVAGPPGYELQGALGRGGTRGV